jgi:hypothetical protein
MPVLVFRDRDGSGLSVANVGNGPAMNIIFAQGRATDGSEGPIALKKGIHESWFNPIHLTPIEPGGSLRVPWDTGDGLGLSYSDVFGKTYVVKASEDGMAILEGKRHLPDWSTRHDAKYLFELDGAEPDGPHWAERKPHQD